MCQCDGSGEVLAQRQRTTRESRERGECEVALGKICTADGSTSVVRVVGAIGRGKVSKEGQQLRIQCEQEGLYLEERVRGKWFDDGKMDEEWKEREKEGFEERRKRKKGTSTAKGTRNSGRRSSRRQPTGRGPGQFGATLRLCHREWGPPCHSL